jgi:phosphopantothenate-cysteine ligase/phosphopantothenoylcysteine decarboxylase/phosphopantothenate--cysteine ligase
MNILVTAGNTLTPIDRVRAITNIFTGQTGANIAREAALRDHHVTFLTSHPEILERHVRINVTPYRTFADLEKCMREALHSSRFEALIHCAAVSDYESGGIYAAEPGTYFDKQSHIWHHTETARPRLTPVTAGKVKSNHPELWLRLVRTPKLIDYVRNEWAFHGVLVKFKLEVGLNERELVQVAEESRGQSRADLMVANTLDEMHDWALLGPLGGGYERVERSALATRLLEAVELHHKDRQHG